MSEMCCMWVQYVSKMQDVFFLFLCNRESFFFVELCRFVCYFILLVEGKIWDSLCCLSPGLGPVTKDIKYMEKSQGMEIPKLFSIFITINSDSRHSKSLACTPCTLLVCTPMCPITVLAVVYHFKFTCSSTGLSSKTSKDLYSNNIWW